jgi:hypothetical protein
MDETTQPEDLYSALLLEVDYGDDDAAAHAVVEAKWLPEPLTSHVALAYRDRLNRTGPALAEAYAQAIAAARLVLGPDGTCRGRTGRNQV